MVAGLRVALLTASAFRWQKNDTATRLYRRAGFEETGRSLMRLRLANGKAS